MSCNILTKTRHAARDLYSHFTSQSLPLAICAYLTLCLQSQMILIQQTQMKP